MTESGKLGEGDDGGLGYMYGSTGRACGGRAMGARAVCADAGEDMPERAGRTQRETRCANNAAWLLLGGRESYQESGPTLRTGWQDLRRLASTQTGRAERNARPCEAASGGTCPTKVDCKMRRFAWDDTIDYRTSNLTVEQTLLVEPAT